MNKKIRIIVVGIGGVGGYFGGLLAKEYFESDNVEIIFIARGEHLKKIKSDGLTVIKGKEEFTVHPFLATDNFTEAGYADFIILCTKSYDLEETIGQLNPCLGTNSVIIPLLNGVDSVQRIKAILPDVTVSEGCAYIVSHIKEPGVIENIGNVQKIFFGLDDTSDERFSTLEKIMQQAGIDATFSQTISTIVWTKFIFISAIATATSYYDKTVGEVAEKHDDILFKLIEELKQIALAKNIPVDKDITHKTLHRLKNVPYNNTTSMQRDFKSNKPHTELESLTNYVIKAGHELNIPTPTYQNLFTLLKNKKE
ncbi:MAG: ketopantoate reductase family protein [Ginsengibacter sp.]|jgi:2-dehydropantoate 2-reductase